jgi:hypothetical protein
MESDQSSSELIKVLLADVHTFFREGSRGCSLPSPLIGLLRAPKGPSPLTAWEPETRDRCMANRHAGGGKEFARAKPGS